MSDDDAIDTALAMIDPRGWGVRLRIVALVRSLARSSADGWARISYKQAAKVVHCSDRYAYELLMKPGHLWRHERVLVRGRAGAGTRPTEWRVNHHIEGWWGVQWLEPDRELRSLRLSAARGLLRDPYVAELADLAPRSLCRGASHGDGRSPGVNQLRDEAASSAIQAGPSRSKESLAPRHRDRGASNGDSGPSLYSSLGEADASLSRAREQVLIDAIVQKTGRHVGGRLVSGVRRLVERVEDVQVLVNAVAGAPAELLPPMLIEHHLPAVLAGTVPMAAKAPSDAPRRDPVQALAHLEVLLATYREAGFDELVPGILDEIATLRGEVDERRTAVG